MPKSYEKELLLIFGPTSSGKSKLAIELALKIQGEIINFDSMQLYKMMKIGVSSPTEYENSIVRHHLYNLYPIWKKSTVYEHSMRSLQIVEEIFQRGKIPILVGGSYLYARAFLECYFIKHRYKIRIIITELNFETIKKRVKRLPSLGFINEVSLLMKKYLAFTPSAQYAIGYRTCMQYLSGIISFQECMELIEKETVHLGKLQRKRSLFFKINYEKFNLNLIDR